MQIEKSKLFKLELITENANMTRNAINKSNLSKERKNEELEKLKTETKELLCKILYN